MGGEPRNDLDRHRSCRLEHFAPLVELPGTEWVSFQVGPRAADLRAGGWHGLIRELPAAAVPFDATADALTEVDLVITVDTSLAHLAGAVGRPVWTLLSAVSDWRWILGRSDTPWYPTMRLFRQAAPGDWDGVFREVRDALAARVAEAGWVWTSMFMRARGYDRSRVFRLRRQPLRDQLVQVVDAAGHLVDAVADVSDHLVDAVAEVSVHLVDAVAEVSVHLVDAVAEVSVISPVLELEPADQPDDGQRGCERYGDDPANESGVCGVVQDFEHSD